MHHISQVLLSKSKKKSCSLIPFITAGYPNIQMTMQILKILDREGADIIELGIPFNDALADGPIIQETSKLALLQQISIDEILHAVKAYVPIISAPIVIFSYFNPILYKGVKNFVQDLDDAGVKGLIIPDLPFEEMDYLIDLCCQYNIELILFIAPTSSTRRRLQIIQKAPGCIYLVSNTGVTGIRNKVNESLTHLILDLKKITSKPIMLGFGISSPDQARIVSQWDIDGVVIGSALMKNLMDSSASMMLTNISLFLKRIKCALL